MRSVRFVGIAAFLAALGGCVVVPVEPVGYGPPAAVVVQPTYGYSYYGYRRHWHRRHRYWR
jgi:hypothetical protein